MPEELQKKKLANELAKERSRQAADRTLMAWVRTCLSLIGFGFGITQFRDILIKVGLVRTHPTHLNLAMIFGLSFIALGVMGLLAATLQHWRILQQIKNDVFYYTGFRPLVFILAIMLMILGLFAFVAVLFY